MNRYRCGRCRYIYDPQVGDLEGGVPAGTPFESVPGSWVCPISGTQKQGFYAEGAKPAVRPEKPEKAAKLAAPAPAAAAPPAPVADPVPARAVEGLEWTVGPLKQLKSSSG